MKRILGSTLVLFLALAVAPQMAAQSDSEIRFTIRSDPKTLNPLLVADDASETVRYLTGGVLLRVHRQTQVLLPELATSWKVTNGGRTIRFQLRESVSFSDGRPFTAEDVAFTIRKMMDPELKSPTADSFRSGEGAVEVSVGGPHTVTITFPAPVAGLERLFDQVAILSAHAASPEQAVLGPFTIAEHKPGSYLLLQRNPNYWKRDSAGRQLPYVGAVRLLIQQNRDTELLRLRRGELHLINSVDAELFEQLAGEGAVKALDAGPSLDPEMMWFNQVAAAPIPANKKAWFRSRNFRRAVSHAINREDLVRLVFLGHATPAVGPFSPANHFWFNQSLKAHAFDRKEALRLLALDGFRLEGEALKDREGQPVEFSVITNAGNKARERMATMMQQDLAQIGIRLNVVPLDFPSLIERITQSFNYEACLLGLVNVDLDPNGQMNVWLSSASNHQWNPSQKTPETSWEAEIDRLMRLQASASEPKKRKEYFDKVQAIVWEEAPFIYLVNKNALTAVSRSLRNASPVPLRPQTYWNIEYLDLAEPPRGGSQ